MDVDHGGCGGARRGSGPVKSSISSGALAREDDTMKTGSCADRGRVLVFHRKTSLQKEC